MRRTSANTAATEANTAARTRSSPPDNPSRCVSLRTESDSDARHSLRCDLTPHHCQRGGVTSGPSELRTRRSSPNPAFTCEETQLRVRLGHPTRKGSGGLKQTNSWTGIRSANLPRICAPDPPRIPPVAPGHCDLIPESGVTSHRGHSQPSKMRRDSQQNPARRTRSRTRRTRFRTHDTRFRTHPDTPDRHTTQQNGTHVTRELTLKQARATKTTGKEGNACLESRSGQVRTMKPGNRHLRQSQYCSTLALHPVLPDRVGLRNTGFAFDVFFGHRRLCRTGKRI